MRRAFFLGIALALASASGAAAFVATNGYRVSGGAGEIEVFGPSGGTNLFCAAGEFARYRLGARAFDRVILTRPVGPSLTQPHQRSAIFRLGGPEDKTPWGGGIFLITFQQTGLNRSVGHAVALCGRE